MPCRHQARLLPVILPEHVIARHRTKFRAFFKIPGKEDITREWDRIKHEYRLLITEQEKQFCIDNAKLLQSQQMASLPYDFWENFGPSQSSVNGVISDIVASNNVGGPESFFSGSFSQDISLSQSDPASATSVQLLPSVSMVHQNSNSYDSTLSKVKAILNTLQLCSDPEVEGFFNKELDAIIGQVHGKVLEQFANDTSLSGECVSLSVPVDRRQKCKRIKSKSEPQRKNAQLYRGERTKVQLSVSSIVNTRSDDFGLEI